MAGVEEEGWFSQTYLGLLTELWGEPCIQRIRSGNAWSDGAACACMALIRNPLREEIRTKEKNGGVPMFAGDGVVVRGGDSGGGGDGGGGGHGVDGIFYLKLHKVGSTTVTNALVNRWVVN